MGRVLAMANTLPGHRTRITRTPARTAIPHAAPAVSRRARRFADAAGEGAR